MTDDQGDVEQQAEEAVEAADAALAERSRDDLEAAQAELEEALQAVSGDSPMVMRLQEKLQLVTQELEALSNILKADAATQHEVIQNLGDGERADSPAPVARPWLLPVFVACLVVLLGGLAAVLIIGGGGQDRIVTVNSKHAAIAKGTATPGEAATIGHATITTGPTDTQSAVGSATTTTSQAATSAPDSGDAPTTGTGETAPSSTSSSAASSTSSPDDTQDYGETSGGGGPVVK